MMNAFWIGEPYDSLSTADCISLAARLQKALHIAVSADEQHYFRAQVRNLHALVVVRSGDPTAPISCFQMAPETSEHNGDSGAEKREADSQPSRLCDIAVSYLIEEALIYAEPNSLAAGFAREFSNYSRKSDK